MKILFFTNRIHNISLLLDEAICLAKEGHDVYFLYNNCTTKICECNQYRNSLFCEICHKKMTKCLKLLPKNITKINIQDYWDECKKFHFDYDTAEDIKRIEYKEVKVGYAVMSAYISRNRNKSPLINEESREYFDLLITTSCRITDALEKAINKVAPDKIYMGNARFFDARPAYDLAKQRGIDVVCIDKMTNWEGTSYKDIFVNSTPNDIQGLQHRRDTLWADEAIPVQEKIVIGKNFFERRRNGLRTNDKVYIGEQTKGQMPKDWDSMKTNIVIFNSSEDELAAIGEEYDKLMLFPSQYQGIRYILDVTKGNNNVHVYLRIHPNLSRVPYRYHTELQKLEEIYDNVTVIPGADPISSYDLMEAAEKVVVFGSSMGMEAAYWGKPVILLSGACYYYSNLCYVPKTKEELKILLTQALKSKNNIEAIKWGFYFMYRLPKDSPQNIDIDTDWFRIGKYHFENVHYLKLLGSSKLYAMYLHLITKKYRKHITELEVPLEEDKNAEI